MVNTINPYLLKHFRYWIYENLFLLLEWQNLTFFDIFARLGSDGRIFMLLLDFRLFVADWSISLLKKSLKDDLKNPQKLYPKLPYKWVPFCDSVIKFQLKNIKAKRTFKMQGYKAITEENSHIFNENFCTYILSGNRRRQVRSKAVYKYNATISRIDTLKKKFKKHQSTLDKKRGDYFFMFAFLPPIYTEPIFLDKMLRFRNRPTKWKHRSMDKIDRDNYIRAIKFIHFNLLKKIRLLIKNFKSIKRFININITFFRKVYNSFRDFKKLVERLWRNLTQITTLIFFRDGHSMFLHEIKKLVMSFKHMRHFIRARKLVFKQHLISLKEDLNTAHNYLINLKKIYKRHINFRKKNNLMIIYHLGYQFFFLKLAKMYFDFFKLYELILREFKITGVTLFLFFKNILDGFNFIKFFYVYLKHDFRVLWLRNNHFFNIDDKLNLYLLYIKLKKNDKKSNYFF